MGISRRSFLKSSAAATALTMTAGAAQTVLGETASTTFSPGPGNKWPGKVVVNFNKDVVTGTKSNPKIDDTIAAKMVDESILALAEKSTVGEAWKAIFPDTLKATSKIAIKTNFYTTNLCCVRWSVIKAITDGLQLMDFSGTKFPATNITVYESNNNNTFESAGYAASSFPGVALVHEGTNKQPTYSDAATDETRYCTSLNKADFLINVFGIRGHQSYCEGVTLGFKSHWGTYNADINKHGNSVGPFSIRCAHMMSSGVVYKKQVLSIAAGLVGNYKDVNNNPTSPAQDYSTYAKKMDSTATTFGTSTIIMSTDPISADMQAVKVMQMQNGKTWGVSDMPKYLQACAGISGALSGISYNIGKINENDMTIKKIINSSGTTPIRAAKKIQNESNSYSLHISPLKGQGTVLIEYKVPVSQMGSNSIISVYDMLGNLIFSHEQNIRGVLNQFSWNRQTAQGKVLGTGKYVCKLTIGNVNRSVAFSIV